MRDFAAEITRMVAERKQGAYVSEPLVCSDGFELSVQASRTHYCTPRVDSPSNAWTHFECGYPSEAEPLLMEYAEDPSIPTGTVYGWVPAEVIASVIEKHGGLAA